MFMKISKEMFDTFSTFNKKFAYVSAINLFFLVKVQSVIVNFACQSSTVCLFVIH